MERCVLIASLPKLAGRFDPASTLTEPSMIDVWTLDRKTEMSRYIEGSMSRAPPRKELLATLELTHEGIHTYGEFPCKSGAFLTVELLCSPSSPSCLVDFWQDGRVSPPRGESEPTHAVKT